ncbi:uncharacterized protein PGTG_00948 [Puccinia graminis f. sp. tritici CRL 75-36-700-3]|uniref:Uncharacterized protein n=1 Tax=Puccinia graminis f. sp. tritici (strain CRL 75-36-700-3 / race SCCL) TaxID=418459 RepID=E3JU92_PUCGT|nr:uncharacterized protein PGTG_00948 [Puccinia graminis f. sp. tritici CRL 75-36-700-3]EFP75617.2 hypothetical protein PGTG_00948 [Puccinia graminis f. sp. tritici CRL 75-36-700-3]
MFTVGPWDIHQLGPNSLKDNQMYGSFSYISSIVANLPDKGETNIGVEIVGYGSRATALLNSNVYLLFGRVFGYGVVAELEEITTPGQSDSAARTLRVVLRHTDYHNTLKQAVSFSTIYYIPGNSLLRGTFGSFYRGREVVLGGYILNFVESESAWEVQVLLVSLSQGGRPNSQAASPLWFICSHSYTISKRFGSAAAGSSPSASNTIGSGVLGTPISQMRVSSGTPGTVVPTPNASIGNFSPQETRTEEGEVSEDNNPYDFGTTTGQLSQSSTKTPTPAKRPAAPLPVAKAIGGSSTLSNAQKRLKNKA